MFVAQTACLRADDDDAKSETKPAVSQARCGCNHAGLGNGGGKQILYNAVAGTITVGATDAQDAQLGLNGQPEPGSQLANAEPKEAKDADPTARMFFVSYAKRDEKAENRPDHVLL